MRKSKKVLFILFFIVAIFCCGCEQQENNQEENTDYTLSEQKDIKNIPNGQYTVLDVRETIGGNNLRIYYNISIVLKDSNDIQTYYSYNCDDDKDSTYIALATLVPNNKVQYQNGTFKIISEKE